MSASARGGLIVWPDFSHSKNQAKRMIISLRSLLARATCGSGRENLNFIIYPEKDATTHAGQGHPHHRRQAK